MLINQKLTKAGVAQEPSGEGLLTCCSTTARRPHHENSDVSVPHQVFFGFSDEVDAAFGAGVIGVGTLLRTTATSVL